MTRRLNHVCGPASGISEWEGGDSARALEIARAKELLSPRRRTLTVFRLTD